jgi:dTMP kinase
MISDRFFTLEGKESIMRPKGARFIVFEGIDGCGKSTAAKLLYEHLRNEGREVILTKEPSLESEAGRKIRRILRGEIVVSVEERQQLFTDDRDEHVTRVIMPGLEAGKIVISDRYFFSTFALGAATGADLEWLIRINTKFIMPDLCILVAVTPEVGLGRVRARGEGMELHDKMDIQQRAADTYALLAKRFGNIRTVDGEKPIPEVFEAVRSIYENEME